MANIEMNYYSGSEYIPLKPMADFSNISGSLTATQIPNLPASKVNSGTFSTNQIPNLSASKINSGTFSTNQIPYLSASKINSGIFSTSQIPNLDASKITSGTISADRLPSSGSVKSQILSYIGTNSYNVTLNLSYTRPYFIIGGQSDYTSFGFFASELKAYMQIICTRDKNGGFLLDVGGYIAQASGTILTFMADSFNSGNVYHLENSVFQINNTKFSGVRWGDGNGESTTRTYYCEDNINYIFLVIY